MASAKSFSVVILLVLICFPSDCDASRRRRRCRHAACPVKNCDITLWSYWSYCSTDQCGQEGSQSRSRTIVSKPACGGTESPDNLNETRQCYGSKTVDCKLTYWTRSCQQTGCFNGGSPKEGVCFCRAGFSVNAASCKVTSSRKLKTISPAQTQTHYVSTS